MVAFDVPFHPTPAARAFADAFALGNLNLEAALTLAEHGIAVFPIRTFPKPDGSGWEKIPLVKWRQEATTAPAVLRRWWTQWPNALPGIDCERAKLVVIDADRHGGGPDGLASLDTLQSAHGPFPRGPVTGTAGGGLHLFFCQPAKGVPLGNAEGKLRGLGINIRGAGGCVVAPGAIRPDGKSWHPAKDTPELGEAHSGGSIPEVPGWIVDAIRAPAAPAYEPPPRPLPTGEREQAYAQNALERECQAVASAPNGTRNETLNRAAFAAGQLVGAGWLTAGAAHGALIASAKAAGLPQPEAQATILSGLKAGRANPRPPLEKRERHDEAPAVEIRLGLPAHDPETGEILEEEEEEEEEELDEEEAEEASPIDPALTHLPGLMGELVDWITAAGSTGNRVLALSAALPLLGTLLGRRMATPTRGGGGLELYIISTLESGGGKSDGIACVTRILEALKLDAHLAPPDFRSGAALSDHICEEPLSLSIVDEISDYFSNVLSGKTHMMDLEKEIKSLWGRGFTSYRTGHSLGRRSKKVFSPCYSIYGLTTQDNLFRTIKSKDVTSGFINRFMVMDGGAKTSQIATENPRRPPDGLLKKLAKLYNMGSNKEGNLAGAMKKGADVDPEPVIVPWASAMAEQEYRNFEARCLNAMRDHGMIGQLYSRTAYMAIKMATIRACCEASGVTQDHIKWAGTLAMQSADLFRAQLAGRMVDPLSYPELMAKITEQFTKPTKKGADLMRRHGAGVLPRRFLWQNLKHHTGRNVNDFANTIKAMADNGELGFERVPCSGQKNGVELIVHLKTAAKSRRKAR